MFTGCSQDFIRVYCGSDGSYGPGGPGGPVWSRGSVGVCPKIVKYQV